MEFSKLYSDSEVYFATGEEGKWVLNGPTKTGRAVCEVKFQPRYPQGENYNSISARMKTIKEANHESFTTSEEFRLWHYVSPDEIGYAQSVSEAKILVGMLQEGDDGLDDCEQQLLDNGFVFAREYNDNAFREPRRWYRHKEIRGLDVSVSNNVHCSYSNGPRWHHLFELRGDDNRNSKVVGSPNGNILVAADRPLLIPRAYPEFITDYRKVAARFIIWMTGERIVRKNSTKKRFYTPLG
jgi:hypothetical protein